MTEIERFTKDPRRAQLLRQEQLILEVSEQIARWLTRRGEKARLARRLGVTKPRVSQILAGDNLSLRTLADIAGALGLTVTVSLTKAKR